MKKTLIVILLLTLALLITESADAQIELSPAGPGQFTNSQTTLILNNNSTISPTDDFLKNINTTRDPYADVMTSKMSDGAINATTSWADIPKQVYQVSKDENIFVGSTVGLGEGIIMGATRGAAGAVDIATLGLTPSDEPVMQPEYKVKDPNKDGYKIQLFSW